MRDWTYITVGLVVAWAAMTAGARINGGSLSSAINWSTGLLSLASALLAGVYATGTWVRDLVGWVVSIHPVVSLLALAGTLLSIAAIIPVLLLDKWSAAGATIPVVAATFFLPSLLVVGAVPGEAGEVLTEGVGVLARALIRATNGWFG